MSDYPHGQHCVLAKAADQKIGCATCNLIYSSRSPVRTNRFIQLAAPVMQETANFRIAVVDRSIGNAGGDHVSQFAFSLVALLDDLSKLLVTSDRSSRIAALRLYMSELFDGKYFVSDGSGNVSDGSGKMHRTC
jgi:hypothetical protein